MFCFVGLLADGLVLCFALGWWLVFTMLLVIYFAYCLDELFGLFCFCCLLALFNCGGLFWDFCLV